MHRTPMVKFQWHPCMLACMYAYWLVWFKFGPDSHYICMHRFTTSYSMYSNRVQSITYLYLAQHHCIQHPKIVNNKVPNGVPMTNTQKYLGSLFSADGQQMHDIKARVMMTMKRCGQLRHLFDSPDLGPRIKIRLYITSVFLPTHLRMGVLDPVKQSDWNTERIKQPNALQNHG